MSRAFDARFCSLVIFFPLQRVSLKHLIVWTRAFTLLKGEQKVASKDLR
jgi:hypothetical protein